MGRQTYGAQDAPGANIETAPAIFPLQVAPSGRYLQQPNGTPFRLKIDAAWITSCHGTIEAQNEYMQGLKQLSFNGFVLMNIVHAGGGAWVDINEPANIYGVQPFTTPNDFSTPNDVYFDFIAGIVERALKLDLVVAFAHTYLGYLGGPQGWESVIDAQSNAVCFGWGAYLRQKFGRFPNLILLNGGDNELTGTSLTRYQQIMLGWQSAGARFLLGGAEWLNPDELTSEQAGFTYEPSAASSDMQINWFYGDGPGFNFLTYPTADRGWQVRSTVANSPLPVVLGEPPYFGTLVNTTVTTREMCRSAQYWAFCAGSIAGSNYGEKNRWDWVPLAWEATMNSPSTRDQYYRHTLLDSLSWWLMRPSGTAAGYAGKLLITSSNTADATWIQACMSSDGKQLLAYIPPTGTGATSFTVDQSGMSGAGVAKWFNPTTGQYTTIGASSPSAGQAYVTPGNNGAGFNDWLLVVVAP